MPIRQQRVDTTAAPTNNNIKMTNDTVGHIGGTAARRKCMEIIMSDVWVNAVASHHTSQIDCGQTFVANAKCDAPEKFYGNDEFGYAAFGDCGA